MTTPGAFDIARDRWGRPLIPPPGGGKPIPYTRVSTLAKALDETSALSKWMCRRVAEGMGTRPDLVALAAARRGDEKELGRVAEAAMDAAKSDAAANTGTALHTFAEQVDEGHIDITDVPEPHRADIAAYRGALESAGIVVAACEKFVICEELTAAGTFDRLLALPDGRLVIGDIKTSRNPKTDYLALPTAIQVAVYARGALFDPATGARTPLPADKAEGILIHVPQGSGTATLHRLDLATGWIAANLAWDVRSTRKLKPVKPF